MGVIYVGQYIVLPERLAANKQVKLLIKFEKQTLFRLGVALNKHNNRGHLPLHSQQVPRCFGRYGCTCRYI
ncbi:hypothetical protein PULV_a3118 [Pseudoalteromonas ulvae UL12]|nr:hypothetical protein [Pseudoalteromonas ulvae UL12]